MDGSVGLLWEEWDKARETMERKRYTEIGGWCEMFWRIIWRNEPRWKRWDELKAESDYAVKARNGSRVVWCHSSERDAAWAFMSSYGSIWISVSHLSSKDRPSVLISRLVMASSNKQTNKKQKTERSTHLNRRKAFWTSVQLSGFISQEPLKGNREALQRRTKRPLRPRLGEQISCRSTAITPISGEMKAIIRLKWANKPSP